MQDVPGAASAVVSVPCNPFCAAETLTLKTRRCEAMPCSWCARATATSAGTQRRLKGEIAKKGFKVDGVCGDTEFGTLGRVYREVGARSTLDIPHWWAGSPKHATLQSSSSMLRSYNL